MNLFPRRATRALALSALALALAAPTVYAAGDDAGKIDTGFPGAGMGAAPKAEATPAVDPAKPIAKVNGETLHQSDIDKYMAMVEQQVMQMQMAGRQVPPTAVEQARKGATVSVVRQALVEQAVKSEESKITDAEVQKEIDSITGFMKTMHRDLEKELSSGGKSIDSLKGSLRKQLAQNKLLEEQEGLKPPTDDEIKAAYDELKTQGAITMPEQVSASHILIGFDGDARDPNRKPPTDAEKAAKKKKAEEVLAQAKKGEDFAKLAKANSTDDTNKDHGGDLGTFGRGRMTKNFENAAFETKPGELSGLVETEFGYHIIKVSDHDATKTLTMDDLKYQLGQRILAEKARTKMPVWLASLQKKAKIEMLDGSKMPAPDSAMGAAE